MGELDILGTVISLFSLFLCIVSDHLCNTMILTGQKIKSPLARCLSGENCAIALGTKFDNRKQE